MADSVSASQEVQVIPFSAMIGGSLSAVVQAQVQAAQTTIEFIQRYGFAPGTTNSKGTVMGAARSVSFQYEMFDEEGLLTQKRMSMPLLSIMPIPYIRIESTEVDFHARIHEVIRETTTEQGLAESAPINRTPVSFQGTFSQNSSKSSTSDKSYQLQVKVRAVQSELPEGLTQLLRSIEAATMQQTVNLIDVTLTVEKKGGFLNLLQYEASEPIDYYIVKRDGESLYQGTNTFYADRTVQPDQPYTYLVEAYRLTSKSPLGRQSVTVLADSNQIYKIDIGMSQSMVLKGDGVLRIWGGNGWGQSGRNISQTYILRPSVLASLDGVVDMSGSYYHTIALKQDGTVWAFGRNNFGQLGIGTTSDQAQSIPQRVWNLRDVVEVKSASEHNMAILADGRLMAWGANTLGQLGDGLQINQSVPVPVPLPPVKSVAVGSSHTLALDKEGQVWSWGGNELGQLGLGHNQYLASNRTPQKVPGMSNVVAIEAGWYHSIALKADGSVWVFGGNQFYQLGCDKATLTYQPTPIRVGGIGGNTNLAVTAVQCGTEHTIVLDQNGDVWTWGQNSSGELGLGYTGIGNRTNPYTPQKVAGLSNVVQIASIGRHNLALKADGTVWSWGSNGSGQLGDGTRDGRFIPIQVYGL